MKRPAGCCPPLRVPNPRRGAADRALLACLRAAADPTRLRMLRLLAAAGAPVCVCDVTSRFRLGQPTISHHLRILREAGLVATSRRGIWAHYAVRPAGLALLGRGIARLSRVACCGGTGSSCGGGATGGREAGPGSAAGRIVSAFVRARKPASPAGPR